MTPTSRVESSYHWEQQQCSLIMCEDNGMHGPSNQGDKLSTPLEGHRFGCGFVHYAHHFEYQFLHLFKLCQFAGCNICILSTCVFIVPTCLFCSHVHFFYCNYYIQIINLGFMTHFIRCCCKASTLYQYWGLLVPILECDNAFDVCTRWQHKHSQGVMHVVLFFFCHFFFSP